MFDFKRVLSFLVANFGPLLVFYGVNHFEGLRTAIIASIGFSLLEIAYKLWKKTPFTGFFAFSVLITFVFGALDLWVQTPIFFRYEASISNLITAIYFGMSLRNSKSIIQEFAEQKKGAVITEPDTVFRCRVLTVIWTVYFVIKASAYTYLSTRFSIEEAMIIRSVVGSASFYALLGFSIFMSKSFFRFLQSKKIIPDYRTE